MKVKNNKYNSITSKKLFSRVIYIIKEKSLFSSIQRVIPLCIKTSKGKMILPGSILSIFINTFILLPVVYLLWSTIYKFSKGINDLSEATLLTYVLMARLMATIDTSIGIGYSLRNGDIAFKLVRPVNYIFLCIATSIGNILSQFVIGVLPVSIICLLIFKPVPLISIQCVIFFVSLLLSIIVMMLLSLTVELLTFWTLNDWGLMMIYSGISSILSGAVIPIELFPKSIGKILELLPFSATINTPLIFITREISFNHGIINIFIQLIWIIVLSIIIKLLWTRAIKKVVILGG